jgi:hypothetical protein
MGSFMKRDVVRAGTEETNLIGRTMRAGKSTQAAMNGVGMCAVAKTPGHKSRRALRHDFR